MKLQLILLNALLAVNCLPQATTVSATYMPRPTHDITLPKSPILTGYWQNWQGPNFIQLKDVPKEYDLVSVAFMVTPDRTTNSANFTPCYDPVQFKQDVATLKARGQRVILSVGGATSPFDVNSTDSATYLALNLYFTMTQFGFDGVDIDIQSQIYPEFLALAMRNLKAVYGNFILTMSPETLYVQPKGTYFDLIQRLKDMVTIVNTQYYNSGTMFGADGNIYTPGTVDFVTSQAAILLQILEPSQVGLGFPAAPGVANTGYLDPSDIRNAYSCLTALNGCGKFKPAQAYPGLGGFMTWSINYDSKQRYAFATSVKKAL